ncbi:MAG: hypothetical protein JXM70_20500 [Pirellulales bacterium]|nr:hypothetical protein [Pirellulales bacterium]
MVSFVRSFLLGTCPYFILLLASVACAGDSVLYNGIELPAEWPPRAKDFSSEPLRPTYLVSPPKVIPIDVGRQLFVDDFLIANTNLKRTYHRPKFYEGNPVLKPDKLWEMEGRGPIAMPFSGGIWFDEKDKLLKMWYMGGWIKSVCYATSKDGIHWDKPILDVVPGTNIVCKHERDSSTVWRDDRVKDPGQRFKMMFYDAGKLFFSYSADGIHWSKLLAVAPPVSGDRSTFFFNPFRNKWVFSIRSSSRLGRSRHYWEGDDFMSPVREGWKSGTVIWTAADKLDWPRNDFNVPAQLYNLDCVAYESLFVGLFSIWRGDYRYNAKSEEAVKLQKLGRPK